MGKFFSKRFIIRSRFFKELPIRLMKAKMMILIMRKLIKKRLKIFDKNADKNNER
jgi:hypothetical protein